MKYIIKNCPSYNKAEGLGIGICLDEYNLKCELNPDCLMKRIVKECKNIKCDVLIHAIHKNKIRKNRCGAIDGMPMCCEVMAKKELLRLLEIEEVE